MSKVTDRYHELGGTDKQMTATDAAHCQRLATMVLAEQVERLADIAKTQAELKANQFVKETLEGKPAGPAPPPIVDVPPGVDIAGFGAGYARGWDDRNRKTQEAEPTPRLTGRVLEDLQDRACRNLMPTGMTLTEFTDWLRSLYPELYQAIAKERDAYRPLHDPENPFLYRCPKCNHFHYAAKAGDYQCPHCPERAFMPLLPPPDEEQAP